MSSVILYIMRATCFSGLESSAKFRRGRPLGPMFFGSGMWHVAQLPPSAASQPSMMSRTCLPSRSFGKTFRFVGLGNVRGGGGGPPAFCDGGLAAGAGWGACALVETASAATRVAVAVANRENRVFVKAENFLASEMVCLLVQDEILRDLDDAPLQVLRARYERIPRHSESHRPIGGLFNADPPGSHRLLQPEAVIADLQFRGGIRHVQPVMARSCNAQRLAHPARPRRQLPQKRVVAWNIGRK